MDAKDNTILNNEDDKHMVYVAVFGAVLFFSLFSISSFLLWYSPSSFVELLINSHFMSRFITVVISLVSFFTLRRVKVLKSPTCCVFIYCIAVLISVSSLFFARTAEAKFLGSSPPVSVILIFSSVLFISGVTDGKTIVVEDIFLSSFVEGLSVMLLLLCGDYAGAIICFFTLTILYFTFSFSFGTKVLFLTLFSVSCIITLLLLSPTFVNVYFKSLSQSAYFMNFFRQIETYLAPVSLFSPDTVLQGGVIFAFMYRFKIIGLALYILCLLTLDILLFSLSAKYSKDSDVQQARYTYAVSVYIALDIVCVLLSLVTSLPFFAYDLMFLTASDIAVFVSIAALGIVFER